VRPLALEKRVERLEAMLSGQVDMVIESPLHNHENITETRQVKIRPKEEE